MKKDQPSFVFRRQPRELLLGFVPCLRPMSTAVFGSLKMGHEWVAEVPPTHNYAGWEAGA